MAWTLVEWPCLVCGTLAHCELGPHGAVWCSSAHAVAPVGWVEDSAGYSLFVPPGFPDDRSASASIEPAQEDRDRRAVLLAAREREELKRAASLVRRGQKNHPLALEHFRLLGVPVGELEGGLPPGVLVLEDGKAQGWGEGPVVALCFAGADHKLVGAQVRPVDPKGRAERGRGREGAMLGRCFGGSLRIGQEFAQKVLVLAESVEDGLAIAAVTKWTVWAAWSRASALSIDLPAEKLAQRAEWILYALASDLREREVHGELEPEDHEPLQAAANKFPRLKVGWSLPLGEKMGENCDTWRKLYERAGPERFKEVLINTHGLEPAGRAGSGGEPSPRGARVVLPERILSNNNLERARRALRELYAPDEMRPGRGWMVRFWDGQWWRFAGTHWVPLPEEGLRADLRVWLNRFWTKTLNRKEEEIVKPLNPSERAVSELEATLQTDTFVHAKAMPIWLVDDFGEADGELLGEARPWERTIDIDDIREAGRPDPRELVACRNGLVDIRAWLQRRGVLLPHSELLFSGACLPYECPAALLRDVAGDDEALEAAIARLCPLWVEFLDVVSGGDTAWQDCLAQAMGYSLLPMVDLAIITLLHGPPRAGKSTVLDAWRWLLGPDNVGVSDMYQITRPFHLQALVGKYLCVMPDADVGGQTDRVYAAEQLKKISGGDPVFVDRKNEKALPQHELWCKIVIACNRMPNIPDPSGALAGRFRVLPFEESFLGRERPEFRSRETMLKEALGRLLWALRGLRQLHAKGRMDQPERGLQLLAEYSEYADPVGAFVRECLDVWDEGKQPDEAKAYRVASAALYEAWKKWCDDNGHKYQSTTGWFGKELRTACPKIRRTQRQEGGTRTRIYEGLRIKPEATVWGERPPH